MAHMINVTSIDNEIMEMDEPEDAQFSIISHSRALVSPNEKEYDLISRKVDQLMQEGRGECIFEVGLGSDPPASDDTNTELPPPEDAESASGLNEADYNASVATLRSIAMSLDSDCVLLRERVLSSGSGSSISSEAKRTGQYLIRKKADMKVISTGAQKIVPLGKSSQKEKRKMLPFFKIVKNRTGKSSQN